MRFVAGGSAVDRCPGCGEEIPVGSEHLHSRGRDRRGPYTNPAAAEKENP